MPREFGREQIGLRRLAGLAQAAVAVTQPPAGLHDRAVTVRLRAEAGQGGLKDHGRLVHAALTEQQPAEPEPRPGRESLAPGHRVGVVGRLQRVLGGLLVRAVALQRVGEQEAQ
ncbi:hypothetical protein, partial [Streptomyces sp. SPB074]|uniref:hypothetical protein n=1 Tax=Streptomyces sp. (strain SPB074) TaxID=465543 RepID=UPI00131A15D6